jgi:hypothetical protein
MADGNGASEEAAAKAHSPEVVFEQLVVYVVVSCRRDADLNTER